MKVGKRDGVTVISTEERLDTLDGPKLKDVVRDLARELAQEQRLKVVIDMGITRFMDSMGCRELLSCLKAVTKNQGDMKIARPAPMVLKILQLTELDRLFQIYDTVESAVESFA